MAEIHGQAPAHAAEDVAPQAGDEVLHTEHGVTSQAPVTGPELPPRTTAGRTGWPQQKGSPGRLAPGPQQLQHPR